MNKEYLEFAKQIANYADKVMMKIMRNQLI